MRMAQPTPRPDDTVRGRAGAPSYSPMAPERLSKRLNQSPGLPRTSSLWVPSLLCHLHVLQTSPWHSKMKPSFLIPKLSYTVIQAAAAYKIQSLLRGLTKIYIFEEFPRTQAAWTRMSNCTALLLPTALITAAIIKVVSKYRESPVKLRKNVTRMPFTQ